MEAAVSAIAEVAIAPEPFLAIIGASAVAGVIAATVRFKSISIPSVVLELLLGILIGPYVLGTEVTPPITFFASLGLGMLFFFAGYELDLQRIRGLPLHLALFGWGLSLAIAYTIGGVLTAAGVVLSLLYVGSALSTTAIGTLLPIVTDAGQLRSRLGTHLLAVGAVGELGPVLLLTLLLSAQGTVHNALILLAFLAVSVSLAVLTLRLSAHALPVMRRTLDHSSQLAVRCALVLIFALALLAYRLGLDLLLGGFAAGMITRQLLRNQELPAFESKLTAVAFGLFVPFFFVVSGMKLDVSSVFASPAALLKVVLFFVLFLVVRGTPALLIYRRVLDRRERLALALLSSTQLPLVVAITGIAVAGGHMRPSTAAALVGAALLSTLVFPIVGLQIAERDRTEAATRLRKASRVVAQANAGHE
jgi:Kef-type K+ transport system membrane component KefB